MLMYLALHTMQWLFQKSDVLTPRIKEKNPFQHFHESKQMSLMQDLKLSLEQSSALQVL